MAFDFGLRTSAASADPRSLVPVKAE